MSAARFLDDWNLLRLAVLAATDLGFDGPLATSGCDGRWACRSATGSESVQGASWLVAPKSVLVIVIVEHFVTPSKGPGDARSAVKMTVCLLPS